MNMSVCGWRRRQFRRNWIAEVFSEFLQPRKENPEKPIRDDGTFMPAAESSSMLAAFLCKELVEIERPRLA